MCGIGEELPSAGSYVFGIGGRGSLPAPPQSFRNACRGPVDVLGQERRRRRDSLLSTGRYCLGRGEGVRSRGLIFIAWARMGPADPFQSTVQITEVRRSRTRPARSLLRVPSAVLAVSVGERRR
jgi:hypothetical protein